MTIFGEGSLAEQPDQLRAEPLGVRPYIYHSLDGSVSSNLRALRDHVVVGEDDVITLRDQLQAYIIKELLYPADPLVKTKDQLQQGLWRLTPDREQVLAALVQETKVTIQAAVEEQELQALWGPSVAESFTQEVLIDSPQLGAEPVKEAERQSLLTFTAPSGRIRELKVSELAMVLYHLHRNRSPREALTLLVSTQQALGNRSPRDIVDTGTPVEYGRLHAWAKALRTEAEAVHPVM